MGEYSKRKQYRYHEVNLSLTVALVGSMRGGAKAKQDLMPSLSRQRCISPEKMWIQGRPKPPHVAGSVSQFNFIGLLISLLRSSGR